MEVVHASGTQKWKGSINALLALFIACADGGANRLMDLNLQGEERSICVNPLYEIFIDAEVEVS